MIQTRPAEAPAATLGVQRLIRKAIFIVTDNQNYDLAYTAMGTKLANDVVDEFNRLRDAERQGEQPDPLVTYTDPAGGPDWEPREDEA